MAAPAEQAILLERRSKMRFASKLGNDTYKVLESLFSFCFVISSSMSMLGPCKIKFGVFSFNILYMIFLVFLK